MNDDSAEYWDDAADSGPLARPSSTVKLSDLSLWLTSLELFTADVFNDRGWDRRFVPGSLIEA
jgi:hypothetical protein